ncbi:histidine triad nucleotide-binding protein [Chloroflexota bacterium]
MDCIFCKIVAGDIPSDILYQDEQIIAFRDINPVAPTHLLIIPKKHVTSLTDLSGDETSLIGDMIHAANQLAKREDIYESGYRLVINCGKEGCQLVPHLHMHLIGGRQLSGRIG